VSAAVCSDGVSLLVFAIVIVKKQQVEKKKNEKEPTQIIDCFDSLHETSVRLSMSLPPRNRVLLMTQSLSFGCYFLQPTTTTVLSKGTFRGSTNHTEHQYKQQ
jgi:hypothetical protein